MKNIKIRIISALLCLVLSLNCALLCSCNDGAADDNASQTKANGEIVKDGDYSEINFTAMNTYASIKANCSSDVLQSAADLLSSISEKLDCFNGTELKSLNENSGGKCEETSYQAIIGALNAYTSTSGAYNPCYYYLKELWKINDESAPLPSDDQIKSALNQCDIKKISLQSNILELNGVKLDLGGIAKGFAANKVVEQLKSSGATSGVVTVGGTVATFGRKNGKEKWNVAVQDPRGESGEKIGELSLYNSYISTSGDYMQYKTVDGKRYCHIFGEDGKPVSNGIMSVTVVSSNGTENDALSTALFAMGKEKALKYLNERTDVGAIIVTDDNEVTVTMGLKRKFNLTNDKYKVNYYLQLSTSTAIPTDYYVQN